LNLLILLDVSPTLWPNALLLTRTAQLSRDRLSGVYTPWYWALRGWMLLSSDRRLPWYRQFISARILLILDLLLTEGWALAIDVPRWVRFSEELCFCFPFSSRRKRMRLLRTPRDSIVNVLSPVESTIELIVYQTIESWCLFGWLFCFRPWW
jgi:hypothetical protein